MTLEQKQEVAKQAAQKLYNVTRDGFIAGGYLRDILLGVKPKDIDMFLSSSVYNTDEVRDAIADRIFAAFGQTWTKENPLAQQEGAEPYGPAADNAERFFVYYMATTDRSWEPVNLVFSRNNNRGNNFDWSICCVWLDRIEGGWEFGYNPRDLDLNECRLLDTTYMPQVTAHALRLREKYPQIKFKFPHQYLTSKPGVYEELIRGGVFDVPRENLQAEGQEVAGNQVGLDLGARPRIRTRPTANAAIQAEHARILRELQWERLIRAGVQVEQMRFIVDDVQF